MVRLLVLPTNFKLLLVGGCLLLWVHAVLVRAGQDCTGLRMFDENGQVFNFTCTDFDGTRSCSFGPYYFPEHLQQNHSVSKPRDSNVTVFRRNFTDDSGVTYLSSGLLFTWKVPVAEISRHSTKGYYIKMMRAGTGQMQCRLFDLLNFSLTSSKIHFSYEFFPFNNTVSESYVIQLYSLPLPGDAQFEEGLFAQLAATIPERHDFRPSTVVYPRYWITVVHLTQYPAHGTVQVHFALPEKGSLAKFTSYDLKMVTQEPRTVLQTVVYNAVGSDTVGRYNFTDVPSGTYQVIVAPRDQGCQCWYIHQDLGYEECQEGCEWSYSDFFNFTTRIPASEPEMEGISTKVWLVPLLVVVGVMVIFIVVFLLVRRQKGKRGGGLNRNTNNPDMFLDYDTDGLGPHGSLEVTSTEKEGYVPRLCRKTVLLLASEDHKYFQQAVDMFARFLQLHCHCDVVFAPQQVPELRKTANSYCWLSRHIDTADFVVIVTSEAASHLYSAFQRGQRYKEADWGPEGDLFTPGLQHVCGKIDCNESVANVLMVCFDHTSPAHHLPIAPLRSRLYPLPSHLTSFLHHVHSLDDRTMDLSQVSLPLKGNVEELATGQEWLTAVRDSSAFQHLHPDCFQHKFGTPVDALASLPDTLLHSKKDSRDSGIGELGSLPRRSSSVSTHAWQSGETQSPDPTQENPDPSDFIAPSVFLYDANSAVTVPFSAYMLTERPPEIDGGSSYTDRFHQLNQRYEQELQKQRDPVPERTTYAMTDQELDETVFIFPDCFRAESQDCVDSEGSSLSSAQSV